MKNPFPGMDPYLEREWEDFHTHFIIVAKELLQPQLPPELRAMVERRLIVSTYPVGSRPIRPDVYVVGRSYPADRIREPGGVAVDEPAIIRFETEQDSQAYVQIYTADGDRLITSIELLSPSNKASGAGREEYLKKQREVLAAGASLVEIDLLRAGECVLALPGHHVPPENRSVYSACVRRARQPQEAEFYSIGLGDRLPRLRIPLRESDEDVRLDLQAIVDRFFETSRRWLSDYRFPVEPPLSVDDAGWAQERLRVASGHDS